MTTKTKDELLAEIVRLRNRIAALEGPASAQPDGNRVEFSHDRGPAIDAGGLAASGGSSNLTPLLELILQKAIALIGAAGGMILLWDEEAQALAARVWIEQPFASVTTRIRLGEGLCGAAAAQRKGLIINDYRNWPGALRPIIEHTPITSGVVEPLLYRDQLIGVVNLHNGDTGRAFSERDGELLRLFADQAAIAIENTRLYAAAQRELAERERIQVALQARTQQLEAVRSVSAELTRELDLSRLLNLILQRAMLLVAAEGGAVCLWDDTIQAVVPTVWTHFDPLMRGNPIQLGEGLIGSVAASHEGMCVNDYQNWPQARRLIREETKITAAIAEPLLYHSRLIGVLNLHTQVSGHAFSDQDRELLRLLGTHAAIAIENARLYEASGRATRQARSLYEIAHSLTTSLDLDEVLRLICERIMELLGTTHAQVVLWDDASQTLRLGAARGTEVDLVKEQTFRLGEGVNGIVAQTRRPLIVNDYQAFPHRIPEFTKLVANIGVPLLYQDRLLGVLASHTTRAGYVFSEEHLGLLTSLAVHAAIAIEHAGLFEQLRQSVTRLEQAQDELVRSEKLRALGQMSAGIAHDLNNMLAAVLGQVELLKFRVRDPDVREGLDILERATMDGAQVVRRLQDFARQRVQSALGQVDLTQVIQEAVDLTRPRWEDEPQRRGAAIRVETKFAPNLQVLGHPAELREVLTNLIFNAVDAMPMGGILTVCARSVAERDKRGVPWVECSLMDTGIGMSEDVRRRIFDPFFTTKGVRGTGLGLSVVYGIMERHGGRVMVQSTPGAGTTLTLRLQAAVSVPPPAAEPAALVVGSPRRILLIEDETAVRETMASLLRAAGHQVMEVESGLQGLLHLERCPTELVLTDLGMPEMTGWDVARIVRAKKPGLPVILLTGWGEHLPDEEAEEGLVDRILGKPVRLAELLEAIRVITARSAER